MDTLIAPVQSLLAMTCVVSMVPWLAITIACQIMVQLGWVAWRPARDDFAITGDDWRLPE